MESQVTKVLEQHKVQVSKLERKFLLDKHQKLRGKCLVTQIFKLP